MPVLYYLRHGETDWNAEGRIQGQTDIPLNDRGRGQAARNGFVLKQLGLAHGRLDFVASPLVRARETMEIVRRELALPPHGYRTDDRLKEIAFGDLERKTWHFIHSCAPDLVRGRDADTYNWVAPGPGGESYARLRERVERWWGELRSDTLCVAHGGVMRVLRLVIEGIDPATAVALSAPQDKVMLVTGGRISWV